MQLFINQDDLQSLEPNLAIRWCLSQEEREYFAQNELIPFVVLVAAKNDRNGYWNGSLEDWRVVRASDLMTYMSFKSAGPKIIFAALITQEENRFDIVKHTIFRYKDDLVSGYRQLGDNPTTRQLERWLGSVFLDHYGFKGEFEIHSRTSLMNLQVGDDLFAKEPFDFKIINWFFKSKPQNQCKFRGRRIAFYSLLPLFLVYGLLKLVFAALRWIFQDEYGSLRPIWSFLLVVTGLLLISYFIGYHLGIGGTGHFGRLSVGGGFLISLVCLFKFIYWALGKIPASDQDILAKEMSSLNDLACELVPAKVNLESLPREKQTFYLRFQATKARICKPFAK